MVEVRYGDVNIVADLAGKTLAEAREQLQEDLNIPDIAIANLNGKRIKGRHEARTCLNDDDRILFIDKRSTGVFPIVAGLVVVLTLCGGWFAYATTTSENMLNINLTNGELDFANVTVNNSSPLNWPLMASTYGTTGNGTLFDIDTVSSNYTGDLIATIYCINGSELVDVYRYLNMYVTVFDSNNNVLDINDDGSENISSDRALLTLKNGSVELIINQINTDVYTVKVTDGYFLTHASWASGHGSPSLYCELINK